MSGGKRRHHPVRDGLEYLLVIFLYGIYRLLPRSWGPALGAFLGETAYHLIPRRRQITLKNLRLAFSTPDFNPVAVALAVYRSVGKSLMEFLAAIDQDREAILRTVQQVEGLSNLDEAVRQGKGVIILGFHYGNWELMNLIHSALGYPTHVVGRALDNPRLNRLINRQRERFGSVVLNSKDPSSLRQILTALHQKKMVGFLIDQNVVGDRGVYVDFFGRLAYTHKVVALVALKTGASIVPMFMHREDGGRHRLVYGRSLSLMRTGNREHDVLTNTQLMTRVIEEAVRRHPEQWLWMHDRWKKQPQAGTRAVFLDRDGTISQEVGYIRDIDHLQLLPNSAKAIRRLKAGGMKVIVVTNQSGVARGYFSEDHVRRVNDRLTALLKAEGAELDGIYYCPHHPTKGTGAYTQSCRCRKPEPGMLLQAASDQPIDLGRSFVVGDKLTDMEMAHRVGAKGVMVLTGYGQEEIGRKGETGPEPDRVVHDLEKAAEWILSQLETTEGGSGSTGTDD
ncbi:MAG: D-glycero-beta-D-manno-heptose 1,7-bisphosphate 7-phosphatase [Nitrospirae bacterium]|nr:D-glycero-beta-D-manno-heptose 1,7-bisphosphate 7-phosphatase [Nitrospirota bacterium]